MTGKTAFVIGARGFVGSNTVRSLLAAGWDVHCFGPAMPDDQLTDVADQVRGTEGSVTDTDTMTRAMQASGARVVLSFAAFSAGSGGLARSGEIDAARAFEINVDGMRRTFDAALAAGIRRVLWSSSTTLYGPSALYPDQPIDEDAPFRPQMVYGLTKAMAELVSDYYRDRHALEAVAVRLPLIFGPGLWYQGAAAALLAMFRAARPGGVHELRGPADPLDLMYVRDVAEVLVRLCDHAAPLAGRYNINGFTTSYPEIARAAERAVPGFSVRFHEVAPTVLYPLISTRRLEADIRFSPRYDLDAAVVDYIRTLEDS
jgi:UDP-glucose 4-epimerase